MFSFLSDPAAGTTFSSSGLSHLEPIQGYRLFHVDNADLHQDYANGDLPMNLFHQHSTNRARSLAAHSQRKRMVDGLVQPFPDQVTMEFHAFGRRFYLPDMQLITGLYVPNSKTTVMDNESGTSYEVPNVLQSYHYADTTLGLEVTATIHDDGLFHAFIKEHDPETGRSIETYQVSPIQDHESYFTSAPHAFSSLKKAAVHDMVAFKYSDLEDVAGSHQCGAATESTNTTTGEKSAIYSSEPLNLSLARKLTLAPGEGVERWTKSVDNIKQLNDNMMCDIFVSTLLIACLCFCLTLQLLLW